MSNNLPQTPRRVNPHVTVIRDSQVFRWLRHDGRTIRTSNSAWTDVTAAVTAARSIADCYSVPFVVAVSWNSVGEAAHA
jgi:hypothetical protein